MKKPPTGAWGPRSIPLLLYTPIWGPASSCGVPSFLPPPGRRGALRAAVGMREPRRLLHDDRSLHVRVIDADVVVGSGLVEGETVTLPLIEIARVECFRRRGRGRRVRHGVFVG